MTPSKQRTELSIMDMQFPSLSSVGDGSLLFYIWSHRHHFICITVKTWIKWLCSQRASVIWSPVRPGFCLQDWIGTCFFNPLFLNNHFKQLSWVHKLFIYLYFYFSYSLNFCLITKETFMLRIDSMIYYYIFKHTPASFWEPRTKHINTPTYKGTSGGRGAHL